MKNKKQKINYDEQMRDLVASFGEVNKEYFSIIYSMKVE